MRKLFNHKITVRFDRRFTVMVNGRKIFDSPTIKRVVYGPKAGKPMG